MTDQDQDPGTELVAYQTRTVDLRNAATDSWTDVLEQVADLAVKIANTDFVPESYRGAPGQVAATVLHGREIGFGPMTALATTHSIKGKPSISAEAMRALVLQGGHEIVIVESSGSRVVMKGRRRGSEEWTTVTWTLDDVRKAKITNHNYQTYPRQMLAARCTAELCRLVFPDVIHGLRAAEELLDDVDQVTELAPVEQSEAKTSTVQRRPRKRAAKAAEPNAENDQQDQAAEPPKPPERLRPDLPAPKTAPEPPKTTESETNSPASDPSPQAAPPVQQPAPEPGPATADASDDGEVVDAEIVTGRRSGPKISASQRASVIMHFKRLDIEDRDERLLITNSLLDLEPGTIDTTSNLRGDEPVRLLKILETLRDRDALDARLNGQEQLT